MPLIVMPVRLASLIEVFVRLILSNTTSLISTGFAEGGGALVDDDVVSAEVAVPRETRLFHVDIIEPCSCQANIVKV